MRNQYVKKIILSSVIYMNLCFSTTLPLAGSASIEVPYLNEKPNLADKTLDVVLGRPLLVATTVAGAVLLAGTLPVTILTQNPGETGNAYLLAPERGLFMRCLGCTFNMAAYEK